MLRPKEPAIHQTQSLLHSVARWWMSLWNCRDIQGTRQHNKSGYRSEVRGFLSLWSHGRSSSCLHTKSSLCHDGFRLSCRACEDATWLRFQWGKDLMRKIDRVKIRSCVCLYFQFAPNNGHLSAPGHAEMCWKALQMGYPGFSMIHYRLAGWQQWSSVHVSAAPFEENTWWSTI